MKINATGFQRFLRRPDAEFFAVLVFGNDAGQVSENIDKLKHIWLDKKDDPFAETIYSTGQLATSGNSLADEMAAFSMLGGNRLVHIKNPNAEESKSIIAALKSFAGDKPKPVAKLIVEATSLKASSALRKTFEQDKLKTMALACYPDQAADVLRIAKQELSEAGHDIEPAALALLGASVPRDRLVLRMELEKLICYMSDQTGTKITPDHVRAVIANAGEASVDDLVFFSTEGNSTAADLALQRALGAGQAPVMIVRAIGRHLFRLHDVLAATREGTSIGNAIANLRPPVFIMHRDRFARQCASWSLARLEKALNGTLETEKNLKSSSGIDHSILGRFVLAISSLTN